eukprot:5887261-Ditylum_brightwellii.AAC.1
MRTQKRVFLDTVKKDDNGYFSRTREINHQLTPVMLLASGTPLDMYFLSQKTMKLTLRRPVTAMMVEIAAHQPAIMQTVGKGM